METALGYTQSKGFTIVELMVTMAISAILIASMYGIFSSQNRICGEEEQIIEMQQNARVAMKLLERELRMAGFWGCSTPGNFKNTVRGQAGTMLAMQPIQGQNNLAAGNTYGAKEGTDLVVISYADQNGSLRVDTPYMGQESANIHLEPPPNPSPVNEGDIVLISDCKYTSVFQVIQLNENGRSLVHNEEQGHGANIPHPGNSDKDLGHVYKGDAFVYALKMKYYWISPTNQLMVSQGGCSGANYTINNSTQPIADNIEDLQLEYGADTDANGSPDTWYKANEVANWDNIIAVRVFLLTRSMREIKGYTNTHSYAFSDRPAPGPYNDHIPRYLLESTTSLRNR